MRNKHTSHPSRKPRTTHRSIRSVAVAAALAAHVLPNAHGSGGSGIAPLCGELLRRSADSTIASFHQQRQRARLLPNWSQEHSRAESACDHRRRRTRACLASLPMPCRHGCSRDFELACLPEKNKNSRLRGPARSLKKGRWSPEMRKPRFPPRKTKISRWRTQFFSHAGLWPASHLVASI